MGRGPQDGVGCPSADKGPGKCVCARMCVCVHACVCVRAPARMGPGEGWGKCVSVRAGPRVWVCVCDGCPCLAQGRDGSCTTAHLPGGPSAEQGAAVPASGACPRRAGKVAGFEP